MERAAAEARIYQEHGFHGLMIENMHDRPYLKGAVGPEIVAAMTAIGREVRRATTLPLGVQVLAGANLEAMAVAHACGAAFVRAEGFVFAHVADEGIIESSAGRLLRYRKAIGADAVRVFVDIKKKHSAHAITSDVDLVETAHAAEFFLADGLIVTGVATGRAADARGGARGRGERAGSRPSSDPGSPPTTWPSTRPPTPTSSAPGSRAAASGPARPTPRCDALRAAVEETPGPVA